MRIEITTANSMIVDGKILGWVEPLTGRDRDLGVRFYPAKVENRQLVRGECTEFPTMVRYDFDAARTSQKPSAELAIAILSAS